MGLKISQLNGEYRVVTLPVRGDERGNLVAIESLSDLPFELKRMFVIYGSDQTVVRGCHANRNSRFGFLCASGSCKVKLLGPDGPYADEELTSPDKLMWIDRMVWKEMYDFSEDCVLLVLSDHHYDPDEYVGDFEEYKAILAQEAING